MNFGGSGLEFALFVWIHEPRLKEDVIDLMNTRIYKAFIAAEIEIPYSKHDVFIKNLPQLQARLLTTEPEAAAGPPAPAGHLQPSPQTAAAQVAHALAHNSSILTSSPRRLSGTPG